MSEFVKVHPEPLTIEGFTPFGQAILGATEEPNYKGDGWESLFPAGQVHLPQGELGWVVTKPLPNGLIINDGMEREPEVEIIWPVTGAIIQAVAPPGNLSNHKEQPDADQVQAFLISPGQVIIMHPATWHYAAFPAERSEVLYYFITRDHPREPGWKDVPWIPFINNRGVRITTSP